MEVQTLVVKDCQLTEKRPNKLNTIKFHTRKSGLTAANKKQQTPNIGSIFTTSNYNLTQCLWA